MLYSSSSPPPSFLRFECPNWLAALGNILGFDPAGAASACGPVSASASANSSSYASVNSSASAYVNSSEQLPESGADRAPVHGLGLAIEPVPVPVIVPATLPAIVLCAQLLVIAALLAIHFVVAGCSQQQVASTACVWAIVINCGGEKGSKSIHATTTTHRVILRS